MKKLIAALFAAILLTSAAMASVECADQTIEGLPNSCPTLSSALQRWASPETSHIFENSDGTLTLLRAGCGEDGDKLRIDICSADFQVLSTSFLDYELPLFGGFYHAERYNYIVYGQNNPDFDDSLEVLRIVQYDNGFRRIASAGVSNVYTAIPFDAGSLRMAEQGDRLVVHTSRERYDGHQSQLTLIFRTDPLRLDSEEFGSLNGFKIKRYLNGVFIGGPRYTSHEQQINHVSHSFNQFVRFDGGDIALIDHGDAHERGIELSIISESSDFGYEASQYVLLETPGSAGANQTGISIGGFEISDSSYLVTYSTIDHSRVSIYTSYYMLDQHGEVIYDSFQQRDAAILAASRTDPGSVSVRTLTDYSGHSKCASAPYMIPLGGDRYLVMWERFSCGEGVLSPFCDGVCAVVTDGRGEPLSGELFTPECRLSKDCRPVIYNGLAVWFVDGPAFDIDIPMRSVYWLDVSEYMAPPAEYSVAPGAVKAAGGLSFRALLSGPDQRGLLLAAAYDASGRQLSAAAVPAARWTDMEIKGAEGAAYIIVYRTDDSFRPLCAAKRIEL